jgi:hypothetical protein
MMALCSLQVAAGLWVVRHEVPKAAGAVHCSHWLQALAAHAVVLFLKVAWLPLQAKSEDKQSLDQERLQHS